MGLWICFEFLSREGGRFSFEMPNPNAGKLNDLHATQTSRANHATRATLHCFAFEALVPCQAFRMTELAQEASQSRSPSDKSPEQSTTWFTPPLPVRNFLGPASLALAAPTVGYNHPGSESIILQCTPKHSNTLKQRRINAMYTESKKGKQSIKQPSTQSNAIKRHPRPYIVCNTECGTSASQRQPQVLLRMPCGACCRPTTIQRTTKTKMHPSILTRLLSAPLLKVQLLVV